MEAEFLALLKDHGPWGILLIALFGIWRAVKWFGANVAQPLTQRHLEFVNGLEKRDQQHSECLGKLTETTREMHQLQRQHFQICSGSDHNRPIPSPTG
jgi:hypothetical protein